MRRWPRPFLVCLVGALATNCAGQVADALVDPSKFRLYDCSQLSLTMRDTREKENQLTHLMALARQGAGGDFVGTIAYRAEYEQAKAQHKAASSEWSARNCSSQSKFTSERSIY